MRQRLTDIVYAMTVVTGGTAPVALLALALLLD